ncbi:MAG TPA: hypothetical protein VFC78_10045 [Tepidisphaeraceae bacterium]|nr:hypothetical protein [Tepidisphaeraceae bacterium]
MTLTGTVKDGVVVLEDGAVLADGTAVRVEPIEQPDAPTTLGQRLKRFAGKAKGLPSDMAENHDHYLHGTPKK